MTFPGKVRQVSTVFLIMLQKMKRPSTTVQMVQLQIHVTFTGVYVHFFLTFILILLYHRTHD